MRSRLPASPGSLASPSPLALAALLLCASAAHAQPASDAAPTATDPARGAPEPPAPAPSDRAALWRARYVDARTALTTGDFADAARELDALAADAPTETDRALATELAALAREWAARSLALVSQKDVPDPDVSARAVDKRTGDEIAGLYTVSILYGLGAGGWIDAVTQPRSTAGVVVPPLLLGGAALGGVAALDSGRGMRYGVPTAITAGLFIGVEEGAAWALWNGSQPASDHWSAGTAATVVFGAATAGAAVGGVLGSNVPITPGRALFTQAGALWGGVLAGFTTGALASGAHADRPALFAAGVGLNAGWIGAALAAGGASPSSARVQLVDAGGICGVLLFGGVYFAAANDKVDGHAALGAAALGGATGLITAWFITDHMRGDTPRPPSAQPAAVSNVVPSITPVAGGAALGVSGTLF